jgi:outer membrane protein OmpA-like peptidoglycan-associated protein
MTQRENKRNSLAPRLLLAVLGFVAVSAGAQEAAATRFVGCPVYRDTDAGRKSGCWIVTDSASGIRYDVSDSPSKPILGQQILVEGEPADGPDICGGRALRAVRISVLPDACPAALIPPEGYPSKPSVLPPVFLQPLNVPRKMPAGPFKRTEFQVYFDFGADRLVYQSVETVIEQAMLLATASHARRVSVDGFADTAGFDVSGRHLREDAALAKARADMVREALVRLGVDERSIKPGWHGRPQPVVAAGALRDASRRRVTITVEP